VCSARQARAPLSTCEMQRKRMSRWSKQKSNCELVSHDADDEDGAEQRSNKNEVEEEEEDANIMPVR